MTFIEFFKQQFIEEAATTRKMLSRVPDNQYNYKPHEKSMVMKSPGNTSCRPARLDTFYIDHRRARFSKSI